MSKNSKIILWAAIAVVIIVLVCWGYVTATAVATPVVPVPVSPAAPVSQAQADQTSAVANNGAIQTATPVSGLSTSPKDSSNAALNADLNSIDAQNSGLQTDSSNIDGSLNSGTQAQ